MQLTLRGVFLVLEKTDRILIREIGSPAAPVEMNEELTFRWEVSCTQRCPLGGANLKILDHVGLSVQELSLCKAKQEGEVEVEFTIGAPPKRDRKSCLPPLVLKPAEKSIDLRETLN